ncbi:hypothetical protein H6A65_11205 [Mediterraneibacter glycyrrhizinilyticus]|uniref:hypothetical protein n=1 Tax=Mediterraneibacter glycyrrhizinilyticus TaxID=342942 RepID=UPI00196190AE|nr:hypothetical protein [Mediterraneibacter glycyrrhizinilyticus]MBM6752054.1 hypothetical protein [Mediterraneibacter glycyrrhizinilyticus]HJC89926.1 hypothetical protein [Candidatus Mediterraneibacter excrementigallinarum]
MSDEKSDIRCMNEKREAVIPLRKNRYDRIKSKENRADARRCAALFYDIQQIRQETI